MENDDLQYNYQQFEALCAKWDRDLAECAARHKAVMKRARDGFYATALLYYPELKPHLKEIKKDMDPDLKNWFQQDYETVENMWSRHTDNTRIPWEYPKFKAASFGEGTRGKLTEACYLKYLEVFYTVFPEILDFLPEEIEWINLSTKVSMNDLMEGFYYVTGGLREDSLIDDDEDMI